jgi:DNA polymerase III epsilon subunit-like protein
MEKFTRCKEEKDMNQFDTTILSFGLSPSQQHIIDQTISPIFHHMDCSKRIDDLFDVPAVCLVIEADSMTTGQRRYLDTVFRDRPNESMMIFTNQSRRLFHFEYYKDHLQEITAFQKYYRVLENRIRMPSLIGQSFHVLNDSFVVVDLETSGINPEKDEIIRISAIRVVDYQKTEYFGRLIRPEKPLSPKIEKLTGICNEQLSGCGSVDVVLNEFLEWHNNDLLAVFNREFDISFLENVCERTNRCLNSPSLDVLHVMNKLYPAIISRKVRTAYSRLNIGTSAEDDVERIADIWISCIHRLRSLGLHVVQDIDDTYIYKEDAR